MAELMREADVFVFPSFFEGLAQVQLEAAASGLPVMGTTASGAEDIVCAGETGWVLESGNLEQLVETLAELLRSPGRVERMKARCRAVSEQWSWARYGERWEAILKELSPC